VLIASSSSKKFPLLDALQLLVLFIGTSMRLKQKLFLAIIFYNDTFFVIKMSVVFSTNTYFYHFRKIA
jgi:hypothetical protein